MSDGDDDDDDDVEMVEGKEKKEKKGERRDGWWRLGDPSVESNVAHHPGSRCRGDGVGSR